MISYKHNGDRDMDFNFKYNPCNNPNSRFCIDK